ncbi:MAG: PAS domain-containing protein [Gallionella sp.]|nr:PAS domain-containing protein [Gallionella sp.]
MTYDMEYSLHGLTVLLSVAAVAWAIHLIPLSGRVRAWLWFSVAFALLTTERVFEMLAHDGTLLTEKNHEIIGDLLHFFAAACLLTGIICIRKIFLEYRTSRQQLGQQLDELQRFQRVSVGRELRMKELQAQPTSPGTQVTTDEAQPCADQDAAQERTALLFMLEDLARVQQLNEHAQQEWMATVDALDDPMFLHDAEFRVIRANRAYAVQAGKAFQEIIGQPYYEIFPKAAGPLPCCLRSMEKAEEEEEEEEEVAVGEALYRSRAFSVKDGQGVYLYSVHTLEDITKRKQTEDKLTEQVEELRRWHEATLGREMRVLDLKREVNELLGSAGAPPRYPSADVEAQEV